MQRAVYRVEHDAVVAAVGTTGTRLVDIGCGTGLLTTRLAGDRPDLHVIGFDFSAGMLAQARGRTPHLGWVRGDATQLPFERECVDVVTCTESFHWYPNQQATLHEFTRILRPGGRALITFLNPPLRVTSRLAGRALELAGQPATFPTRTELRVMVEDAGLQMVEQRPIRLLRPLTGPVLTVAAKPS